MDNNQICIKFATRYLNLISELSLLQLLSFFKRQCRNPYLLIRIFTIFYRLKFHIREFRLKLNNESEFSSLISNVINTYLLFHLNTVNEILNCLIQMIELYSLYIFDIILINWITCLNFIKIFQFSYSQCIYCAEY